MAMTLECERWEMNPLLPLLECGGDRMQFQQLFLQLTAGGSRE